VKVFNVVNSIPTSATIDLGSFDLFNSDLRAAAPADAILDRLIHNSYRLPLKGDSMRKQKTAATAKTTKGH